MSSHNHTHDDQDFDITLTVGSVIAITPDEDPASFAEERETISMVQDVLRAEGVVVDLLRNPGFVLWEGGIRRWGDLYRLRQIAVYLENGEDVAPLLKRAPSAEEDVDPLLAEVFGDERPTQFPHLIKHLGESGYYLPVDFATPVWIEHDDALEDDEIADEDEDDIEPDLISFGSSSALQRELYTIGELLNQLKVPATHPVVRCLQALQEAATMSVQNDLPIVIW